MGERIIETKLGTFKEKGHNQRNKQYNKQCKSKQTPIQHVRMVG